MLFLTDKKRRKLESQQRSRLHTEKGHTSTDSTDIFSLPQYIRVMVSNYQPLQTVFSIPEGECHTRPIKTDEQFSPTVTIVDDATQQPLDCILLLQGEKPPEVTCKTLFCYIAVQVSYHDEHGSHHHPLYHMESKTCKQGNLPFIFSFHQPGTLCVIQLSIYSIVDSEGVEYMHQSEDCRCIVRIIDRKQHHCQSRAQHGAVRMKEPPRIRYTGPLATARYNKIKKCFKLLYLSSKNEQIPQLAKRIIDSSDISLDIKIDAMCWEAFVGILEPEHCKDSEKVFEAAMNKASQLDCQNSVLLQGMILKHLGYIQYANCNDDEALKYISAAREILANAVPSQITAQVLFIGLMAKWRKILSTPQGMQDVSLSTSSLNKSIEGDYDLLLEHADFMEEYEQPDLFLFLTEKASFHLRSFIIEDKLPPKALQPTEDDIKKAEQCLNRISVNMLPNEVNPFAALYYRALSDLFLWKQKYSEAFAHAKWGKQLCLEGKIQLGIDIFTQRLQLLESLQLDAQKKESEEEAIDEILKEFSGETIQP